MEQWVEGQFVLIFKQDVASEIAPNILIWGILQFNSCSPNMYSLGSMGLFFKDSIYCLNLRIVKTCSPYYLNTQELKIIL